MGFDGISLAVHRLRSAVCRTGGKRRLVIRRSCRLAWMKSLHPSFDSRINQDGPWDAIESRPLPRAC